MERADGSRRLFNDSKLGILVGLAVSTLSMMLVEWLGTLDFSTLPTWLSTFAAMAAGYVAAAITAWRAKRGYTTDVRKVA